MCTFSLIPKWITTGHWFGNKTTECEIVHALTSSAGTVSARSCGKPTGKMLLLVTATLQNTHTALVMLHGQLLCLVGTVFCAAQSSCDWKPGNQLHKGLKIWYGECLAFIRFQLVYYMLGTTTRLSVLLQVLGIWLHLRETFFLGLGLTVTEQKSTETRLKKTLKM